VADGDPADFEFDDDNASARSAATC